MIYEWLSGRGNQWKRGGRKEGVSGVNMIEVHFTYYIYIYI
jgi:hypothetical protein